MYIRADYAALAARVSQSVKDLERVVARANS